MCVLFQVSRVIDEHRAEIMDKGYHFNISTIMSEYELQVVYTMLYIMWYDLVTKVK